MRTLKQRKYALRFPEDGKTEQSHIPDTDINVIMKRALRGQHTPYMRDNPGSYGDATSLSYLDAHVLVAEAQSMFEDLPSKIRNRFDNDTGKFLEFIHDESNIEEAIELGLIPKQPQIEEPEPIADPPSSSSSLEGGKGDTVPPPGKGDTPPSS